MGRRALLAQAGEYIDKVYDAMMASQKDSHKSFDLTRQDACHGLCFQICSILVSAFLREEAPYLVARELFDEFAGVPAEEQNRGMIAALSVGAGRRRRMPSQEIMKQEMMRSPLAIGLDAIVDD